MYLPSRVPQVLTPPLWLLALTACAPGFSQAQPFRLDPALPSSTQPYHDPANGNDFETHKFPKSVFFPPVPPPLELPNRPATQSRNPFSPTPTDLSAYVNEVFYPELASLLSQNKLPSRKREALQKYHDEKRALQQELRAEFAHCLTLDPPARAARLAELARLQDPKIARLEARAEELRRDLYDQDFDWSALREWHLGEFVDRPDSPVEVAQVMQAAAFFQDGLSLPQRGLLREFAVETFASLPPPSQAPTSLTSRLEGRSSAERAEIIRDFALNSAPIPRPTIPPAKSGSIFFSPSLTRLRLPDNLADSVRAKLADYTLRKTTLRSQLVDTLRKEDASPSGTKRTRRLEAFAATQAPGFAALDALAEDIRRDLAPLAPPESPPPLAPLSADLTRRMIALSDRTLAAERETRLKVDSFPVRYHAITFATTVTPQTLRYSVEPRRGSKPAEVEKAKAELATLAHQYEETIAALTQERTALRAEIAGTLPPDDASLADVALSDAPRLSLAQHLLPTLTAYHFAALEPGLSPAQRRLLFDGVVEDLTPVLPRAEMQPTRRRPAR